MHHIPELIMEPRKCPCGERTSPDPSCEMCDGFSHDPDTGFGGYTNGFTGKHHFDDEERGDSFDVEYDSGELDDNWI